jgi:hypothetical protein
VKNNILEQILNGIPAELVYAILGFLVSVLITKTYEYNKKQIARLKLKKALKILKNKQQKIKVIDLANGDPDFANENIFVRTVNLFGKKKSLFIDMDEEHKKIISEKENKKGFKSHQKTIFQKDISLDGSNSFEDIAQMTQIENLPSLINKHRKIVGEKFIDSKNGLLFNAKKYGIFNLSFTRFGENEQPGVEIDLFETDYFTHRVFRSIYHELKKQNHKITNTNAHNFLQYRPFFTSFGINTLLICEGNNGKEIILSKRSTRINTEKSMYHITMNEGLSISDKDPFGKIDLELCFKRGLLEELGITEKLYNLSKRGSFYDFFLEFNNFEIGLTSVLETELNFEKDIKPLVARDKTLESFKFVSIPLKQKEIKNFIEKNELIPHGQYVLERVLLRENIII